MQVSAWMNILETISTSIRIKRTNALFSKTGRVENYRHVNEPYGDDDGSTSPSYNSSSKNDGRSWYSTRNARNAKKHGQYSKSGKNLKTEILQLEANSWAWVVDAI